MVRLALSSGNGGVLASLYEVDDTTNPGAYQDGFRVGPCSSAEGLGAGSNPAAAVVAR